MWCVLVVKASQETFDGVIWLWSKKWEQACGGRGAGAGVVVRAGGGGGGGEYFETEEIPPSHNPPSVYIWISLLSRDGNSIFPSSMILSFFSA